MIKDYISEKNKFKDKILALLTLAGFTIIVAFLSVIVMDILIFPITLFSIKNTEKFNFLIKLFLPLSTLILLIYFFIKKIYISLKDGYKINEIFYSYLKKLYIYSAVVLSAIATFYVVKSKISLILPYLLIYTGLKFNSLIISSIISVLMLFILYSLLIISVFYSIKIFRMIKNGDKIRSIYGEILTPLYKPMFHIITGLYFLILSAIIIFILYILLNFNYLQIYHLK